MKNFATALSVLLCLCVSISKAQNADTSHQKYDQHKAFPAMFYPPSNEMREASGTQGPKYWQNHADYKLNVTLDTAKHNVSGTDCRNLSLHEGIWNRTRKITLASA